MKNASFEAKEAKITALAIVPGVENRLLCATQNNNIYSTNLKSELMLTDDYVFEQITEPMHFGQVILFVNSHEINFPKRSMDWMYVQESHYW